MNKRIFLALAAALIACQPKTQDSAASDSVVTPKPPADQAAFDTVAKPPVATVNTPGRPPAGGASSGSGPVTVPSRQDLPKPTVREVLETNTYVGQHVRVTGRCLGYSSSVAVGGPPVSRSDWQLGADGVAIYVNGPLPEGCSATGGSESPVMITAVVAEDTLPAFGGRPAMARRYLLRRDP